VLLNNGRRRAFQIQPRSPTLPKFSRRWPAYLTDVDGEGIPDLYMLSEIAFGPQEKRRMDGGLTLSLLKGTRRQLVKK